jgi:hypothetical protein
MKALVVLFTSMVVIASAAERGAGTPQGTSAQRSRAIRALYVTGGGFHDFVTQETILPPGIAKRVRIDWTIDHTAGKATDVLIERHKNTDWTKAFDVAVYNMSFSHVVDAHWIERLAGAHRNSGVPAVILHGAVHSYRRSESKAWGELMGAFSMRHDRQRPLTIEVTAPDHHAGVPTEVADNQRRTLRDRTRLAGHEPARRGAQRRNAKNIPGDLDEHARQGPRLRDVARAQQRDDGESGLPRSRQQRSFVDAQPAARRRRAGAGVYSAVIAMSPPDFV